MDKRIILAVAGSGKTTYIISKLDTERRYLIITYTNNNVVNIKDAIIERFGYFPSNIRLLSYFTFLYSFCYKPILSYKHKVKGIFWERPPQYTSRLNRQDNRYYISTDKRIYHNRMALLCQRVISEIKQRIDKYYDCVMIDEVQDFAGHDFNLLKEMTTSNSEYLLVGDFFQHTFDTSNDGNINKNLFADLGKYIQNFKGIQIDNSTLSNSYRCTPDVCHFVTQKIGIEIHASNKNAGKVLLLEDEDIIRGVIEDNSIIKLFYQNASKYKCHSMNWGSSKGINRFTDVCVVLNKKTMSAHNSNTLSNLPSVTKNKLYVACTRAKRNLYLVDEIKLKSYK